MKKHCFKWLSVLVACAMLFSLLCVPALAAGTGEFDPVDNLIRNPGFEDGAAGWEICPTKDGAWFNTQISDNGATHSGNYSALLGNHTGEWAYIFQDLQVPEDGLYELSAYTMSPVEPGQNSPVFMTVEDVETGEIIGVEELPEDNYEQWQQISMSMELFSSTTYLVSFASELSLMMIDDIALVPTVPKSIDKLDNGGFEAALTGWLQQGIPSAFITDAQARSGENSLFLSYFQTEALNRYVEQTVAGDSGSYDFSAWVKTDKSLSGAGAMLLLEAKDQDGNVLAVAASPAVSDSEGEWKQTSVHLTAPSGTASVTAKIGGVYCTGAFYVDDAQLLYQVNVY